MEKTFDVVGLDTPCMDLLLNVDHLPQPDQGGRVNELSWQGGGKVSTGLVAAARLGAKAAIIGSVGDDGYGRFCRQDFDRHGIDTRHLRLREGRATNLSVALSDRHSGGRSILSHPGSAGFVSEEEIPDEYLRETGWLFLAWASDVTRQAAERAQRFGAKVFMDADTYHEALGDFFPLVDVLVASEYVYEKLFGDDENYEANCRRLRKAGPQIVVFTFGSKGCAGVGDEGFFRLPACDVEVVDTLGAGDVFHGAFLTGLILGRTAEKSAELASAVAGIKCTRIGGRAGIPNLAVAERYMATGEIDYSEIDQRVAQYEKF